MEHLHDRLLCCLGLLQGVSKKELELWGATAHYDLICSNDSFTAENINFIVPQFL